MKVFTTAILLLAGAAAGWAQRGNIMSPGTPGLGVRGTIPPRIYGSPTGFGNILFPGMGTQPPLISPFSFPSTFATRLGATISGSPGFNGAPSGRGFGRGRGANTVVVPYAYPVYMGGYDYGYAQAPYGQQQQPYVIVMPQAQAQPPVTINQNFVPESARPTVREYGPGGQELPPQQGPVTTYSAPTPASSAAADQVLFFIPLKDSTVYTAVAYWVDGETLHYITPQGKHNQVSLALVDRDLAARMNQGRQVEFRLPPAKD